MDIKCCGEHVDLALDMIVDEFEEAPFIHNVDNNNDSSTTCQFCQNTAIYVVSNTNSYTTCGQ
ncbi:CxxH/CxxC protein [Bacillus sp. 165]|uniref:CxxH/CxxC protein n=1 Tax=Bacillus sp. 165 TaxID=1529117 RepID=UPI001ADCB9BC|nr:CxxH/CxxC protein [Bacillus sp. 165]MBO9131339.1 CxxH/CxxC protein [Bacillus sp. 165]